MSEGSCDGCLHQALELVGGKAYVRLFHGRNGYVPVVPVVDTRKGTKVLRCRRQKSPLAAPFRALKNCGLAARLRRGERIPYRYTVKTVKYGHMCP